MNPSENHVVNGHLPGSCLAGYLARNYQKEMNALENVTVGVTTVIGIISSGYDVSNHAHSPRRLIPRYESEPVNGAIIGYCTGE